MNRTGLAAELQALDTRLDENSASRRALEKQIADQTSVNAAKVQADKASHDLAELRARLRALELEVSGLADKIDQVDKQLYGGRVSNAKELQGLDQDEKLLKKQKFDKEDASLDLMAQIESAETEAQARRSVYERALADAQDRSGRARHALEELTKSDVELTRKRDALRQLMKAADLAIYDNLRNTKKGRAVALLKGTSCSACGYAVPSGLASRAKLGDEFVYCINCERILAP